MSEAILGGWAVTVLPFLLAYAGALISAWVSARFETITPLSAMIARR